MYMPRPRKNIKKAQPGLIRKTLRSGIRYGEESIVITNINKPCQSITDTSTAAQTKVDKMPNLPRSPQGIRTASNMDDQVELFNEARTVVDDRNSPALPTESPHSPIGAQDERTYYQGTIPRRQIIPDHQSGNVETNTLVYNSENTPQGDDNRFNTAINMPYDNTHMNQRSNDIDMAKILTAAQDWLLGASNTTTLPGRPTLINIGMDSMFIQFQNWYLNQQQLNPPKPREEIPKRTANIPERNENVPYTYVPNPWEKNARQRTTQNPEHENISAISTPTMFTNDHA
ncbi:hypothetical protein PV328_007740 [Microctonus aethiopoides]|uniref:Uncharacterized protein n=1 Tax=Microctonus aethiopoides TaxID=144406 RepID=A0AA39C9C1_9HYME|nr:hypothetical protein PV328_007740 [Microctonus aethiopoides]